MEPGYCVSSVYSREDLEELRWFKVVSDPFLWQTKNEMEQYTMTTINNALMDYNNNVQWLQWTINHKQLQWTMITTTMNNDNNALQCVATYTKKLLFYSIDNNVYNDYNIVVRSIVSTL